MTTQGGAQQEAQQEVQQEAQQEVLLENLVADMVAAAGQSLSQALGTEVAVASLAAVTGVEAAALEGAFAARSMITGGQAPGGLVTVVPAAGLPGVDGASVAANAVVDALAVGAAAALSQVLAIELQATAAEALPPGPDVAGLATLIVRFEVGAGQASPVPVHWVVEASLAALLGEGAPVAPSTEQGVSAAPTTLPDLKQGLPDLGEGTGQGTPRDLQLLADVPLNVTVELGKAVMRVRELLGLKEGSVVELDKAAGAAVDVLVNGTLVARGDVVVIDDELGVRITEVIDRR